MLDSERIQRDIEQAAPASLEKMAAIAVNEPSFFIYYSQLASEFNHCLHNAGYRVDMSTYNEDYNQLSETLEHWSAQRIAGVALNPSSCTDVIPLIERLRASGVIVVLVGRRIDYPALDYVGADNEGIGYQAARHLIQLGHTQIAYVGDAAQSTGHDRATGYVRAMQEANLAPRLFQGPAANNLTLPAWFTAFDEGSDPMTIWKAMANREITAAFCYNDGTAVWVQNQIHRLNLAVPRDISLVSVDNLPFFQFLDAPLTTFALPGEEVGRRAANLMLRRLAGETFPPQTILLPARFIQRLSTAPAPLA